MNVKFVIFVLVLNNLILTQERNEYDYYNKGLNWTENFPACAGKE